MAAGKHYRDWNAAENYVQKSSVAELLLPERYLGARANFAQDIALIDQIGHPVRVNRDGATDLHRLGQRLRKGAAASGAQRKGEATGIN